MKTRKPFETTLIVGVLCLFHTTLALGQNLLVNGDFEAGNSGFTSEYRFVRLDTGLLTYDVFRKSIDSHFLGLSFGDHTSGKGLMFGANGGNDTNRVLWKQTVQIVENTDYQFSGWATPSIGPNDPDPSRVSVRINGNLINPSFQLSNPPGKWQYFSTTWDSGASATATIELRLETIEQGGNDLALDDLRFEVASQQISGFSSKVVAAPAGLIGWWAGDGNAKDVVGFNDGVATSIGYASGKVGQAFRFVGTNSFIRVPNQPAFNTISNLSLECWFWNDQAKPFRRLMTFTPDWAILSLDDKARPKFAVAIAAAEWLNVLASDPVMPNTWHHVAGTFDGQSTRLYLDGVLLAVVNSPSKLLNDGASPEVYINFIRTGEVAGLIDEAAIYNRALTPAEIQSHFAAGSAGMIRLPRFSEIGVFFPGIARFRLDGRSGIPIRIESSTDLINWSPMATNANFTGTISISDSSAGEFSHRFYRAITQ
jgi:hypothetical protein